MIYFIETHDKSRIKIGFSATDIRWRKAQLQRVEKGPLNLLGVMPGDLAREKEMHAKFANHRLHGEWFSAVPELLMFIRDNTSMDQEGLLTGLVRVVSHIDRKTNEELDRRVEESRVIRKSTLIAVMLARLIEIEAAEKIAAE